MPTLPHDELHGMRRMGPMNQVATHPRNGCSHPLTVHAGRVATKTMTYQPPVGFPHD